MSDAPERIVTSQCGKIIVHHDMKRFETDVEYIRADHVESLLKAEREKTLREAAAISPKSIRNYGMMKPGKPDQFASREAQIVAKGFARLIEEDILALISEDATDG